jgi:hypothetical protein
MVVKYEEIERFGSWGAASMKRKALVDTYGEGNVFIFKELTKTPFTAFRHDQYVVMLRRVTGLRGKK